MNSETWAQLKELFEAVLEQPSAEREAFIRRACAGDPMLQAELQALLSHHLQAGAFLGDSRAGGGDERTFHAGQIVGGRFEMRRFIGQGGMGEVYEAFDRVLSTPVALKTLRLDLAGHIHSARLIEEIRHARKVNHPNVCRVFDLETHHSPSGPILFLTLELLAGETLAARLRRDGALPPDEASATAHAIAGALDAAHRAGIVHRDLKGGNVMLVPEARAFRPVVMDFGLARAADPDAVNSSLTLSGFIAGTPGYIAPELLEGGPATPASDIYSLGVLLCEIASGRQPTQGALPAVLPPVWREPILRCLDPDPTYRPTDALAAVAFLSPGPPPLRAPIILRPGNLRRAALAGLVLMTLFFAILRLYEWNARVPEGATIMLADIPNRTTDPALSGIRALLSSQLSQSSYFDLWDDARRAAVLRQMSLPPTVPLDGSSARQAALREGVPFVLFGDLSSLGDSLVLNLRVEEVAPRTIFPRRLWNHSVTAASRAALADSVHESVRWLRRAIGESVVDFVARDRLPQDTTTPSWQALTLYSQAEQANAAELPDRAISLLEQALALDPGFALASMRLGDILLSLHRDEEGLGRWSAAVAGLSTRPVTTREELRIRGLYASELRDYPAAEAAFSRMKAEYPRDYFASFYLAQALKWQARFDESEKQYLAARDRNTSSLATLSNLAGVYLLSSRPAGLARILAVMEQSGAPDLAAIYRGFAAFSSGDYPAAERHLRAATASPTPEFQSRAWSTLAALLAELGRYPEARAALLDGIAVDLRTGRAGARADKALMLASLDLHDGDARAARRRTLDALATQPGPQRSFRAGVILARAHFPEDARAIEQSFSRYPASPLVTAAVNRISGERALIAGHTTQAVVAFSAAADAEAPLRPKEYLARAYMASGNFARALPILQRLADNPAFLWQTVDFDLPGILTDALNDLAVCAQRSGDLAAAQWARALYARRRPGAANPTTKELP